MKYLILLAALLAGCNDSGHPSVLIIGDSISNGYTPYVSQELRDWTVLHNPGNARYTTYSLQNIHDWIEEAGPVNVIHANWGIWDMSHSRTGSNQPTECDFFIPARTSLEEYRANLEKLAKILEETGARVILATTTPVPTDNPCVKSADVADYNKVLVEVAAEHGFAVDDIYGYVLPYADSLHEPSNSVHFS